MAKSIAARNLWDQVRLKVLRFLRLNLRLLKLVTNMGLPSPSVSAYPTPGSVYTDLLTFAFNGPVRYDKGRPIFIDAENPERALTAGRLRALVRALIAGLRTAGVQKGDCVVVHLGNNVVYSALFYGIVGSGGVYMGVNPGSQPHELDHIFQLAEPKLIITSGDSLPTVAKVAEARGISPSQIRVFDDLAVACLDRYLVSSPFSYAAESAALPQRGSFLSFAELLHHGERDWIRFNDEQTAKATPAALFTTSGTGGLPKAAVISHYAMVSQHLSIQYDVPYEVTRLISLPMFHLFGALWSHIFPIRYGQPLYVMPRFHLEQFVTAIHRYRITETYMIPAMVQAVNRCSLPLEHLLVSLRYIGIAGAAIDAVSMRRCQERLHRDANISQLWGMTEVGVAFQMRYGEHDAASVGRRTPGYEVKLLDGYGNEIHVENEPGELYVRGPGVLTGYRKGPEAKDQDGWVRTGDIMSVRDGKYYLVGRAKELIKVRGWQVAPAEIEAVLLQHPGIAAVAVIGVTQEDGVTEVPRAFVVRNMGLAGRRLTAEEVYTFARKRLASYKALDGGVIFVEDIPLTASGKIQRYKLTQMNSYRDIMTSLLSRCQSPQVCN